MKNKKITNQFNAGTAFWNQRKVLHAHRKQLEKLSEAINRPIDLSLPQYAQLFAIATEFKPTVIIELGRGYGNSTTAFVEAANCLPETKKVLSICLSDSWQKKTVPELKKILEPKWFEKLDARIANIFDINVEQFVLKNDSVLFFWDAHGFDVAEYVLGNILPKLAYNKHLILAHDITDTRYYPGMKNYGKAGIWKGYPGDAAPYYPYVIVNNKASAFEELVVLNDFAERNTIPLNGVEHELRTTIYQNPYRLKKIQQSLGKNITQAHSSIYWFTLNSHNTKYIFPSLYQQTYAKKGGKLSCTKNRPLVSIITPCFNSGKYLEGCIQSVLAQNYPYVEHIIQDGASTDNTKRVLKKYSKSKYRKIIKILSEPDKGQSDGLNRALQKMSGDIFLVLNADDELIENACTWGVEQLTKNPECAAIYGDEYIIDEKGDVISFYVGKNPYRYDRLFCVELVPPAQATFVRTDAFKSVGLYADTTLATCPDYEMWIRLGAKYPIKHVFGPVCKYRHHTESEGKQPDVIPAMVHAKLSVINRVLHDPQTPAEIKRLRKRAYAGLYHWGANMAGSTGLYKKEFFYLWKSFLLRPQLHKAIRLARFARDHVMIRTKTLYHIFLHKIFLSLPQSKQQWLTKTKNKLIYRESNTF